jgi:hypothetical protein
VDHGGCLGYGSNLGMSVLRMGAVGSSTLFQRKVSLKGGLDSNTR